jgi:hypothetical protein
MAARDPALRRGWALVLPWLLGWIALAALVFVLIAPANTASGFSTRAQTTSGTVIGREPTNHAIVRVSYEVSGVGYVVADSFIGPPNPAFADVRVSEIVTVYYDPSAPAIALLSDPRTRSSSEIGFAVLAVVILPTGIIGALLLANWLRRFLPGASRT